MTYYYVAQLALSNGAQLMTMTAACPKYGAQLMIMGPACPKHVASRSLAPAGGSPNPPKNKPKVPKTRTSKPLDRAGRLGRGFHEQVPNLWFFLGGILGFVTFGDLWIFVFWDVWGLAAVL